MGELAQKSKVESADGLVSADYVQATADIPEQSGASSLPPLAIPEIVNQEPLLDSTRGVLHNFCSKTAPLGAKGWTWVGPIISAPPVNDPIEETSPTVWGIPHKMLVKLAGAFANWLKNAQETLQQIGCLPDPPLMFMPHVEEKERFKDVRVQKSLTPISPSAEEVKEYVHKEEYVRYRVPDRVCSYTAINGKKSIVAPLRRCGGEAISKARDHFILNLDRPPHVTILCLVREATSRIPVEMKYVLLLLWNQPVCCGNMEPTCVFNNVDNNRAGKVDLRDILCGFSSLRISYGNDALQLCFQMYDADRSGCIARERITAVLKIPSTFPEDKEI